MNSKDLAPCPFCGGEVYWCKNNREYHEAQDDCHYINCVTCGEFSLNMPDDMEFPEVYEAVKDKWNTRA